jgi:alpha-ribazole phosphatase/probable phosphoglycerate mutase
MVHGGWVDPGVRVWCLRHAESVNVVAGACGAVPAVPLTPAGRAQAATVVPVLAAHRPYRVYTSTAVRAVDTGRIIGAGLGIDLGIGLVVVPDLGEVSLGSAEGATDPATRAETARVLHAWVVHGDLSARVVDGETGHQVIGRITAALDTIAEDNPGRTVVLVGHTASLTAGLAAACGLGATVWGTPLPPATPFLIQRHHGSWHCPHWPQTRYSTRDERPS